ncbi:MAG: DUF2244 domain-containing protein [Alphaproteobacteria bacterium]|nr:DUF2244 domain-containing protein [Alphaproteobacteria bacterium]
MEETQVARDEATAPPVLFYAEMRPHRSLSPMGFWILMAAIGGISFVTGMIFLMAGAWPVFGFFGLDVLLIYVFFRLNYREARAFEALTLTERELLLRKVSPRGKVSSHRFEPYWIRVKIDAPTQTRSRLTLSSHGKTVEIGAFLTEDEKIGLAQEIRNALRRQREHVEPAENLI